MRSSSSSLVLLLLLLPVLHFARSMPGESSIHTRQRASGRTHSRTGQVRRPLLVALPNGRTALYSICRTSVLACARANAAARFDRSYLAPAVTVSSLSLSRLQFSPFSFAQPLSLTPSRRMAIHTEHPSVLLHLSHPLHSPLHSFFPHFVQFHSFPRFVFHVLTLLPPRAAGSMRSRPPPTSTSRHSPAAGVSVSSSSRPRPLGSRRSNRNGRITPSCCGASSSRASSSPCLLGCT